MNDTELTQTGEGLFTEGRWRKRSIAEILALNTHIKRNPSVGPSEAPKKSTGPNARGEMAPPSCYFGFGLRLEPPASITGYGHRATTEASGSRLPRLATMTARYSQRFLSSPSAQSPAIQRQLLLIFPWQQA